MAEPLLDAVSALKALREEVHRVVAETDWTCAGHADAEALAFMLLAIGEVAAVEELARSNVHYVITGTAAARAAYETVVTCAWMLAPAGMAERDSRWTALFIDERTYWTRMVEGAIKRLDATVIVDGLKAEVARVDAIVQALGPELQARGAPPFQRLPTFDKRLEEVGQSGNYVIYKTACQFVHPTTRALAQVRDLTATHSTGAQSITALYRTTARQWTAALILAAESLSLGLKTLEGRMTPTNPLSHDVPGLLQAVGRGIQAIALTA